MEDQLMPKFMIHKIYKEMRGKQHLFEALGDFMCPGKVLTAEESTLAKVACYALSINLREEQDKPKYV